jgi:hypothetical protein
MRARRADGSCAMTARCLHRALAVARTEGAAHTMAVSDVARTIERVLLCLQSSAMRFPMIVA